MGFLLCIIQYVLEMIVLLAVGIAGACIGIKLRKNKDAKAAANQTAATKE
jgi:mannose/fructose/N-acetylgalactosamine-specific phosphotransferase system component IIC